MDTKDEKQELEKKSEEAKDLIEKIKETLLKNMEE